MKNLLRNEILDIERAKVFTFLSVSLACAKRTACRALIFVLFGSVIGSCASSSTDKKYSIYFVQTISSIAQPTEEYIIEYADQVLHTSSSAAEATFREFQMLEKNFNAGDRFEASLLIVRNTDKIKLRLGSNSECRTLVVRKDGMGVCNSAFSERIFDLLFPP